MKDKNLTNTQAQTFVEEENFEEEEDEFDISEKRITYLKEVVNSAPKLELKIIESLYFDEGFTIKINSLGLIGKSLREIKDGYTFFGIIGDKSKKKGKLIDFSTTGEKIDKKNHDIVQQEGRQFYIKYDLGKSCYYIKDCSIKNGYGTFMKVEDEMLIKDNTFINIGNNYIVFTLGVDELESDEIFEGDEQILSVKVFQGDIVNYSYIFNKKKNKIIYFGNNEICDVILNDDIIDDIHCQVEYKEDLGWMIKDGYNNKKTKNGTWLNLSEETEIYEGMIIQSNQNIYQCHIFN